MEDETTDRTVDALLAHAVELLRIEGEKRNLTRQPGPFANEFLEVAALLRATRNYWQIPFEELDVPCLRCEDGVIEFLVPGSESKTERRACVCARGRELTEG